MTTSEIGETTNTSRLVNANLLINLDVSQLSEKQRRVAILKCLRAATVAAHEASEMSDADAETYIESRKSTQRVTGLH